MITSYSQTKIVVTLGPATSSREMLKKMFLAGVDVCRLNFSHGTHEQHAELIKTIRELNSELNSHIAILADLQGPKIRLGVLPENGIAVKENHKITFTTRFSEYQNNLIPIQCPGFAEDVKPGETILVDDGNIRLKVIQARQSDQEVDLEVINGGILRTHKGVNLPETKISAPSLTEKDKKDALFALSQGVDWIALSFVRAPEDVMELRQLIQNYGEETFICAKIEKPEALENIDSIINVSDAIMVARGDLGVEIPYNEVPLVQKTLVKKCIENSKPVIIATQMLESMIEHFRPTRAEVTDVAHAVLEGADALMLSGETSVGKYPLEAIETMQKIIDYTENNAYHYYRHLNEKITRRLIPDYVSDAACSLAQKSNAKAIICFSHSGGSAFRISAHRPRAPIFVFTQDKKLIQKLTLVWGIRAFYFDMDKPTDEAIKESTAFLLDNHLISKGDILVHVTRMPLLDEGATNTLRLGTA